MEPAIHELTAGYALDALDPESRTEYEAHLATCERCRHELASFWQTAEALAVAASGPTPSARLRERILAGAQGERQAVIPLASRRRETVPVLAAVAAVAAVVAVGIGLWAAGVSNDLDETRAALERERAAAAILADPDARTVALQEGEGRLVVGDDGRAVLVLEGLDPAPPGKTYEMWIVAPGGAPAPAGLFPAHDGTDVVALDGVVEGGEVVAVTVEDERGADAPTSEPVAASVPA